jgi:hypothetical protein
MTFSLSPTPLTSTVLAWSLVATLGAAQTTIRISEDPFGNVSDGSCTNDVFADDGEFVAYASQATNLAPGDSNFAFDIFVWNAITGEIERVSLSTGGAEPDLGCFSPDISADGRFVSFVSSAGTLVANGNYNSDVYVRDRLLGTTVQASVDSNETPGNGSSTAAAISDDGRFVAFSSYANNLVASDTNGRSDVFLRDIWLGTTERLSVDTLGIQGNGDSSSPDISGDGFYTCFNSTASNLDVGDTNGAADIFVAHRVTGGIARISISTFGGEADKSSLSPSISQFGNLIAYYSYATNLVPGDMNAEIDIFVRDLATGTTERASVAYDGSEANDLSLLGVISSSGQHVVYSSMATNLVPGGTNSGVWHSYQFDRYTGLVQHLSRNSNGQEGNGHSWTPSIDGQGVQAVFSSDATNLIASDSNGTQDIFVREHWNGMGSNFIYMEGPSTSQVGQPITLNWYSALPFDSYWLYYSFNINGFTFMGHEFDLGAPFTLLDTGMNQFDGTGSFTSSPVPAAAAGQTVFFEVAIRDGLGNFYESSPLATTFF